MIAPAPEVGFGVLLADLIRFALPPTAAVRAGRECLRRRVAWVAWLARTGRGWSGISAGDCVLVAGEAEIELDDAISVALDAGASAIVTDLEPSRDVIARCREAQLPLIVVPAGTSLRSIERAMVALIVNRQAELDQRGAQIYGQLAELVAADKGIGAIVVGLHELTGRIAALEDESGALRFHAGPLPADVSREALARAFAATPPEVAPGSIVGMSATTPPVVERELGAVGLRAYSAPILVEERISGWISVAGSPSELGEVDRIAAGRAAAVSALELAKQRAVSAASGKVRSDFVADLLTGNFATEDSAERRARMLGFQLALPSVVLVWRIRRVKGAGAGGHPSVADLERLVESGLSHLGGRHLIRATGDRVVSLYPLEQPNVESARIWAQRLRARASFCEQLAVGIGRPAERIRDIQRSYEEAEHALELAMLGAYAEHVVAFIDLGAYRLLLPLRDSVELQQFYADTVGMLVEYERRRTARLLPTLRAFVNQNGNVSRTAEVLAIHRNTLLQRLRRIEEITGYNLDDPDARLALHLGLKIAALLDRQ